MAQVFFVITLANHFKANIKHLIKENRNLFADSGGREFSGECPVFKHQGIRKATIGSSMYLCNSIRERRC